jgi:two-component system cell cycle sensor histidine kinase/response regulator CckA
VNDFIASPEYLKIVGKRHDLQVETNISDCILGVVGSEMHISKTVMNLVANAADAMPSGGRMTIATRDCYIDKPYTGFEIIPEGEYAFWRYRTWALGCPHPIWIKFSSRSTRKK